MHRSLTLLIGGAAAISLGSAAHAQERTAATHAIPGTLVVKADQGAMHRIGSGGPARYRAHLAVASRVMGILQRDSGFAHPIGYEMHAWRIAGPNDPPLDRYFPGSSGIYSVLMYYYHDPRATATHGVDVSSEGPGFEVLVNDPACALPAFDFSDERGPFGVAPVRAADYRGNPSFGDGTCLLITAITRPLTVPVSRERWLRAEIRRRRAVLDTMRASEKENSPEAHDSSVAATYRQWLAEKPNRDEQRKETLEAMRRINPASVAKMEQQFRMTDSVQVASFKEAMAHAQTPELQAIQRQLGASDAAAAAAIQKLESELAGLSPAARASPAYIDIRSSTASHLVDAHGPNAQAVVAPNPSFLDRSLPASAPQVITVKVECRRIGGDDVGRSCGGGQADDYMRILEYLDLDALRALTTGRK